MSKRTSGFTLLELSVVLVIVSVVIGMAVTSGVGVIATARQSATEKKIAGIEQALQSFRAANERLPCPSDLTLTQASANYGIEAGSISPGPGSGTCPTSSATPVANFNATAANGAIAAEGGVPTVTLGLPGDFMYDGWGNRIRYGVDIFMTSKSAFTHMPASYTCSAITVYDSTGSTARSSSAVYALVSHGANAHGAYTAAGKIYNGGSTNSNEQTNCHCNSSGTPGTYAPTYVQQEESKDPSNALNSFDDFVTYKERWQMQNGIENPLFSMVVPSFAYNQVLGFSPGGIYQGPLTCLGTGSGNGQLAGPSGAVITGNGILWVLEKTNNRVSGFTFTSGKWVWKKTITNSLSNPSGIALDSGGNIWFTDTDNNRILEYDASGLYVGQISSGLSSPTAITVNANGIFVLNDSGAEIKHFNTSGGLLNTVAIGGNGLASDSNDNIWLTQSGASRALQLTGALAGVVIQTLTTDLQQPTSIAVDKSGNLWIGDDNTNTILKYDSSLTHTLTVPSPCPTFGCPTAGTGPGTWGMSGPVFLNR